jgi:glycosyltransferase involved in cell wall biosynthesis
MEPFITVIVTDHDRRIFLPRALHSLENQSLPRDKFEVIVVKNYEDQAIDNLIRRIGGRNIVTTENNLGGKIAIGVEEAKGEIITFLEDDDVYTPERLQVIWNAFKSQSNLIHFHNEYAYIDENSNFIGYREGYYKYKDLVIPSSIKHKIVDKYIDLTWSTLFNSAIAVRKYILSKRLNYLKHLIHIDPYLFYISLIESGDLIATSKILTLKGVNRLGRYHQINRHPYSIIVNTYIQILIDLLTINERSLSELGCKRCIKDFLLRIAEISSFPKSQKLINVAISPSLLIDIMKAKNIDINVKITMLVNFILQSMPDFIKDISIYTRYMLRQFTKLI